jgi:L-lactate dehydrogenase complex protein LldG
MVSRNKILQAIADAGYPEVTKPKYSLEIIDYQHLVDLFIDVSKRVGADTIIVNSYDDAMGYFQKMRGGTKTNQDEENQNADDYEILLLESRLAVAENGAIWLDESEMTQRVVPFACEHLIVIVNAQNIIANMHDAYSRLKTIYPLSEYPGFGVFIAGPSKTADIEQTLVIGAQGAKKHTIILITS